MLNSKKTYIIKLNLDLKNKIPIKKFYKLSCNNKSIHKKPTIPYIYNELENGKFIKKVGCLPDIKELQEYELIKKFIIVFNTKINNCLSYSKQLSSSDNDFELKYKNNIIVVELTEVSLRGIGYRAGDGIYIPDSSKEYSLLANAIKNKVDKNYYKPKNKQFWLVTFQTDTFSFNSVNNAKDYVRQTLHPFDKIWYFYLYSDKPYGIIKEIF